MSSNVNMDTNVSCLLSLYPNDTTPPSPQTTPPLRHPANPPTNLQQAPQTVSPDEERLRRLYGNKLGKKPAGPIERFRQVKNPKQYFDSGEYAMNQAGKGDALDSSDVGRRQHPLPESIPHPLMPINTSNIGQGPKTPTASPATSPHISQGSQSIGSPIKGPSFLSRETSANDMDDDDDDGAKDGDGLKASHDDIQKQGGDSAQPATDILPIRT